jgi:hypothetical protein
MNDSNEGGTILIPIQCKKQVFIKDFIVKY